ncbi:MAG: lysophospholipid acyltransferase family protein [Rhodothermales bacterium]
MGDEVVAKKELFDLPLIGWLMKWSATSRLIDRASAVGRRSIDAAYLRANCFGHVLPGGHTIRNICTLGEFNSGAFHLAIKEHPPILPLVIDGTSNALQKGSQRFNDPGPIYSRCYHRLRPRGPTKDDAIDLTLRVRGMIDVQFRVSGAANPCRLPPHTRLTTRLETAHPVVWQRIRANRSWSGRPTARGSFSTTRRASQLGVHSATLRRWRPGRRFVCRHARRPSTLSTL